MFTDSRGRSTDHRFVEFKPRSRLRLPHAPHRRLVELRDEAASNDLLVVDDFAAAQYRRARHVRCIEPFQPFGGRMPGDVFGHLVDARRRVYRTCRRRCKADILQQLRIARRP